MAPPFSNKNVCIRGTVVELRGIARGMKALRSSRTLDSPWARPRPGLGAPTALAVHARGVRRREGAATGFEPLAAPKRNAWRKFHIGPSPPADVALHAPTMDPPHQQIRNASPPNAAPTAAASHRHESNPERAHQRDSHAQPAMPRRVIRTQCTASPKRARPPTRVTTPANPTQTRNSNATNDLVGQHLSPMHGHERLKARVS